MERFPANSIQEPTAFMSQDPMELYNNILVFIVMNSNQSHPPEMHIFQVRMKVLSRYICIISWKQKRK